MNRRLKQHGGQFLRTLGIEIAFSREGRLGTRMVKVSTSTETPSAPSASSVPPAAMALTAMRLPLLRSKMSNGGCNDADGADHRRQVWRPEVRTG